ncbi:MAG TPA: hypothetical protein ENN67_04965 [Firmicutes bacterium]|nr:hypothetical protein [Bacillota bacterium]
MTKLKFTIITVVVVLVFLAIAIPVIHLTIESRLFAEILNQPGIEVKIGSRHGNLLTGYTLMNFSVMQTETHADMPASGFKTARLTVHWKLRPFAVTEISWDEAVLTLKPHEGKSEEIEISGGRILPTDPGWLETVSPVSIGPESWNGNATMKIRADGQDISASVEIERLPGRFLMIAGSPPPGFDIPPEAHLQMDLKGAPSNLRASGRVTDLFTRKSFRF